MKVAMIGGTGFVGSYITDELISHNMIPRLLIREGSESKLLQPEKCEIVYGDLKSKNTTPATFEFVRYRITYQCAEDSRIDPKGNGSQTYFDTEKLKFLKKKKEIWNKGNPVSFIVDTNNYPETYPAEIVVKYVLTL